jgi:LacI family transcriptional regulator
MGVTIKDIAAKTGLSITTVSLVLNRKESRISEKTRQIVENTAQEMHYLPSQAAISLTTKKTNTIGLVIPEGSYYRSDDMIGSFERISRNSGFSLTISLPEGDDEACVEAAEAMLRRGIDGLVFDLTTVPVSLLETYMKMVQAIDIPLITITGQVIEGLSNTIMSDHRKGVRLALTHLTGLGHKRIGCILGRQDSGMTMELLRGIEEVRSELNIEAESLPVLFTSHSVAGGYEEVDELLDQGNTGIFAASDKIAHGILRRSFERGINVPGKLSVVGYSNSALAEDLLIPLTSVAVHFDRIARKALHMIQYFDGSKEREEPELIEPSLIVRASSGPAPQ